MLADERNERSGPVDVPTAKDVGVILKHASFYGCHNGYALCIYVH